jgi:hypothetical protein
MRFTKPKISARLKTKYSKPPPPNGERLPDFVHVTGDEYFRLDKPKPYGYVKCVWTDGTPSWWACDPLGHWMPFTVQGYEVFEHEDGTITVSGVIENRGPYQPWWRGTITRGLWEGEAVSDPAPEADEET